MSISQFPGAPRERLEIQVAPGVTLPDWSAVTSETVREALDAIFETCGMDACWSGLEADADRVRRAVLGHYIETGRAPPFARLAAAAEAGADDLRARLADLAARDMIVLDADGETVTGAYPFTDRDSGHRVQIGEVAVNAMCAIDALGAGAMCDSDITIHSSCAACGAAVRVATRGRGAALRRVAPRGAAVWLGVRYADGCAADSLCRSIAFFCSDAHLESWRDANHSGVAGYRLSMDEALQAGRAMFAPLLA